MSLAISGMRHQILSANGQRALDLAAKRRRRLHSQQLAAGRQVDEVIVVDDERLQIVTIPRALQQLNRARLWRRRTPHTWAGGENLEGVSAHLRGFEGGVFKRF